MEVDLVNMTLRLSQEKKNQLVQQFQCILWRSSVTIRWLTAISTAVFPVPLQYWAITRRVCQQRKIMIPLWHWQKRWRETLINGCKTLTSNNSFNFTTIINSISCVFKRMGSLLSGKKSGLTNIQFRLSLVFIKKWNQFIFKW